MVWAHLMVTPIISTEPSEGTHYYVKESVSCISNYIWLLYVNRGVQEAMFLESRGCRAIAMFQ